MKMFTCRNYVLLTAIALSMLQNETLAGDAVVIGYNSAGVWTAVTYYCSGTPSGGNDYKDEAGARETALRDLKKRAGEDLARTSVLAASNMTAYFAYGRGKDLKGVDRHAVGSGATPSEAEKHLLQVLERQGAVTGHKVVYRYHSFGAAAK